MLWPIEVALHSLRESVFVYRPVLQYSSRFAFSVGARGRGSAIEVLEPCPAQIENNASSYVLYLSVPQTKSSL